MDVDESKSNIASNYTQVRKGKKAVDSDHVPLEINIDMKIVPTKPTRNIVLNFKNYQAREIFKELTTHTEEFTKCFETLKPLQEQCETWKETLESYCKKTFPKIRIKPKGIKPSAADKLILEINKLKKKQDENQSTPSDDAILLKHEQAIADILAREGRNKAYMLKTIMCSIWICECEGDVETKEKTLA